MTDRELLVNIKENHDQKSTTILWERYQPFIHKVWIKFASKYKNARIERDDFIQDAYFTFIEAIDKIELDRIDNNFKFYTVFFWYLHNQKREYHRDAHREIKRGNYSYEDMFHAYGADEVLTPESSSYSRLDSTYDFDERYAADRTSEEELRRKHDAFLKKLTIADKKIIELQKQGLKRAEIAKKLGYTYTQVTKIVSHLHEEAREFFDVPHYKKNIKVKN
jgi:RNA polymerase sigma factor (sigma-70 family)